MTEYNCPDCGSGRTYKPVQPIIDPQVDLPLDRECLECAKRAPISEFKTCP